MQFEDQKFKIKRSRKNEEACANLEVVGIIFYYNHNSPVFFFHNDNVQMVEQDDRSSIKSVDSEDETMRQKN